MWVKNNGTAIAIPSENIGLKQDGEWFQVDDALGANLLRQERFVETDENGVEVEPEPPAPEGDADAGGFVTPPPPVTLEPAPYAIPNPPLTEPEAPAPEGDTDAG